MEEIISESVQAQIVFALYVPLAGGVSLCGLAANTVNIIVFSRQGVQESAPMCLLLLAIWDLGVCLSSLLYALCFVVDRNTAPGDVAIYDLSLLISALPRMFFGELSMCTTVVMSLERCLCVSRPLTFKKVINRRNSLILLAILYAEVTCTSVTKFLSYPMSWQWDALANTSRLKMVITNGPESMSVTVHHLLNDVILTTLSIVIVVVCTCVMVAGLKASGRFRQANQSTPIERDQTATSTPPTKPRLSTKEARLVKMVTLVSVIFLTCYAPVMATLVAKKLVPDLNMYGRFSTLNDILWAFLYLTAAINATAAIFVYLRTSTHYRTHFYKLFLGDRK